MSCSILELCKCAGGNICLFCYIARIVCVGILSFVIGHIIGKRKAGKIGSK